MAQQICLLPPVCVYVCLFANVSMSFLSNSFSLLLSLSLSFLFFVYLLILFVKSTHLTSSLSFSNFFFNSIIFRLLLLFNAAVKLLFLFLFLRFNRKQNIRIFYISQIDFSAFTLKRFPYFLSFIN